MKRLISAFAMTLAWACMSLAAEPVTLTTIRSISALTNEEAGGHPPVRFEATVLFFFQPGSSLYVQDGDAAIAVKTTKNVSLIGGDRVLIEGTARPSFLPYVVSSDVTVLRHGALPTPVPATFDDLTGTRIDCRRVRVRGVVRVAEVAMHTKSPQGLLELLMDGGYVDVEVQGNDQAALRNLVDAEVEITGVAGRKFDGKMQSTGVKIKASSLADIKVLKRSNADIWSAQLTPMGRIFMGYHVRDLSQRLRVHGAITFYEPGSAVVLQSGNQSLWVSILTSEPLRIGEVVDASGFPDVRDGRLSLIHADIKDSGVYAPVAPKQATWAELASWGKFRLGGHENDLVSTTGRVVSAVREAAQDEYILAADGRLFAAIYKHPPAMGTAPPMLQVPTGSIIRVTGICFVSSSDPVNHEASFNILLRSFDDIEILARPSLLTIRNLMLVIVLLLATVMAVGVRGWTLERKVRRQTAAVADMERRRRHILEDINGSRRLAEIIREITEVVSSELRGAACWCQITDGAQLGDRPPNFRSLRVIEEKIPSRSGATLGTIFAALDPLSDSCADQREVLSMGAGLAAIAIETRRLYSDLLHRSEFDQLTDIQNRFSLERNLDAMILAARETAGMFGLIYIDLDDFKQVNDLNGHQFGDMYLQEVAARMKRQLRPGDMLARLGGDEFGVLVPVARNRADVEEIALRLKRCFEEPFAIEGHRLRGSASFGIALYPADADNRDSLLSAADAAMYAAKHSRKIGNPNMVDHAR